MNGRLSDEARALRDELETAQALLLCSAADLDEVALRIRQAMRRTGLVSDVLRPALERLEALRADLESMQAELSKNWNAGQKRKWKIHHRQPRWCKKIKGR